MNRKLKFSFNPDGLWDQQLFREIVRSLVNDTERVELYLVTQSTDNAFVTNVVTQSGMTAANVYQVANKDAVLAKMDELLIDIHITGDTPEYMLLTAQAETAYPVIVNDVFDANKRQMKYISNIQFWIKQITRELNASTKESC